MRPDGGLQTPLSATPPTPQLPDATTSLDDVPLNVCGSVVLHATTQWGRTPALCLGLSAAGLIRSQPRSLAASWVRSLSRPLATIRQPVRDPWPVEHLVS